MNKLKKTNGFTFIEITVVLIIVGILASISISVFRNVSEKSKVDVAAANLITIWTAQRLYWAENKTFANSLESLNTQGLIDDGFISMNNDIANTPFGYEIYTIGGGGVAFIAKATRRNSDVWSGILEITEYGIIEGSTTNGSVEIVPMDK